MGIFSCPPQGLLRFPAALVLLLTALSAGAEELTIFYTASLSGNLDGCDCEHFPRSGLVKSAVLLRQAEPERSLTFDLGDFSDAYGDELLGDYILTAYDGLGFDLLLPGDREVGQSPSWFRQASAEHPLTAHNLPRREKGAYTSFLRSGIRIAVTALLDPSALEGYPESVRRRVAIEEPAAFLEDRQALAGLEDYPLSILLFHGPWERALALIRQGLPYDLVLVGHEGLQKPLRRIGGTWVASPGPQGNQVGVIRFAIGEVPRIEQDRFVPFSYRYSPDDPALRRACDSYKAEMIRRLQSGGGG